MTRRRVTSGSSFESVLGFSRAVRVGNRVLVSGTAPIGANGESPSPDADRQTRRCLEIIEAALGEAGAALAHVVRTRVFIADRAHLGAVAEAHAEAFAEIRPACTVVVASLLDESWLVEIEAEAVVEGRADDADPHAE